MLCSTLGVIPALMLTVLPALGQEPQAEPRYEITAIVAGTSDNEEDVTFATIGAEYERRIAARFNPAAEVEICSMRGAGLSRRLWSSDR
jgi:hypothetical protein